MRLFAGISLPGHVTKALVNAQQEMMRCSSAGRFVQKDALYIALHSLGESNKLDLAVYACQDAVRGLQPFALSLGEYQFVQRGLSYSASVRLNGRLDELNLLHETLGAALYEQGFCIDRRFLPHITIGTNIRFERDPNAANIPLCDAGAFTVSHITLFESALYGGRMAFLPLHKQAL